MNLLFEQALNITSPWYVKDIKFSNTTKQLDIYIDFKKGSVFKYENKEECISGEFKAYDTVEKTWRHLNFFEHECYLHARVPRIKPKDGCVRMIDPPWSGLSNGFTLLFEALVLQLATNMPVNVTSRMINESNYKIWDILEKYTETARNTQNYSEITTIGMDETSIRKGHEYITLFVDIRNKKTIFVTEGKDSKTVEKFVEDFKKHNGKPEKIKDVSCDMSPAFIKGVRENLPEAQITFDRFHVMKILNHAVDKVRKEEVKDIPLLLRSKYVFLKNAKNLTEKEKKKKEEIQLSGLKLKSLKALQIRETFQEIYNSEDEETFEYLLKKWYFWATHSRIEPIKEAAQTIKAHWDGIVRWGISRINNGILEGLNSVVQAAKAKARGYRTFRCFRIIVYLLTGKLNFSSVNKNCLPT